MKIYIDGAFYPESEAKISVFDHGLLYGDGVFEGIRFYNGRIFRLDGHLDRLWDSARAIWLTIPISREEMTAALLETVRQNELRDGYIRLVVTRGVGNLGLNPENCAPASSSSPPASPFIPRNNTCAASISSPAAPAAWHLPRSARRSSPSIT